MSDPTNPAIGDLHIDASSINVIDYTPEHLKTLTKLYSGHERAITNLANLSQAQLKAAGINAEEAAATIALAAEHKQIGVFHQASEKMTELLYETRANRAHQIATRIAEFVEQARRRAERSVNGAEILGPLDALLDYQLGPSQRAALTRAKAKKANAILNTDDKPVKADGPTAP